MADVTISSLSPLSVSSGLILPVTDGTSTGKVTIGNINSLAPVQTVFGRAGNVTLASTDVTTALGYTPVDPNNMPSGSLLQSLITSNSTEQLTQTNNQYLDVMSITITPKKANSKIQIQGAVSILMQGIDGTRAGARILRNGVAIHSNPNAVFYTCATSNQMTLIANLLYEDLPNTTSAVVYKIQFFRTSVSNPSAWGGGKVYVNQGGSTSYMKVEELAG